MLFFTTKVTEVNDLKIRHQVCIEGDIYPETYLAYTHIVLYLNVMLL